MTKEKKDVQFPVSVQDNVSVLVANFKENITPFNIKAVKGQASVADITFNPNSRMLEILFLNDKQTVLHLVPVEMTKNMIVFSENK